MHLSEGEPFVFPGFLVRTPASPTSWALIGACSCMKHLLRSGNHLICAGNTMIVDSPQIVCHWLNQFLFCSAETWRRKGQEGEREAGVWAGTEGKGKRARAGERTAGSWEGEGAGTREGKREGTGKRQRPRSQDQRQRARPWLGQRQKLWQECWSQ